MLGSSDRGEVLELATAAGSLAQPPDNARVLTVCAPDGDGTVGGAATCSSRGPTVDGRLKPDVLAPVGLADELRQLFAGTSATAPHAAGMLALLGEAFAGGDAVRGRDAECDAEFVDRAGGAAAGRG
jgi:hypothetical protein